MDMDDDDEDIKLLNIGERARLWTLSDRTGKKPTLFLLIFQA